jgi:hypothetical protein
MIATSACTKSGEDVAPGGAGGIGTGEKGRLTFVLPAADRVVTYTGGSAAENGSTSDLVAVYVFDSSLRFERSYNLSYGDGADVQGGRRYSLTMDGTGERRFVFLQAPSGYPVPQLSAGGSIDALTGAWTQQAAGGRLTPPFVMSNALSGGNPYVTVEDIGYSPVVPVNMKRRVARLDIVNNDSEYTITGVEISNAAPSGRLLDDGSAPTAPVSGGVSYELSPEDLTNNGRSFYLYPTVVKPGNTGTVIKIRTTQTGSGTEKMFTVMTGVDVAIEANKLYRLTVSQSKQSFTITVSDWNDAAQDLVAAIPDIDIYLCMGQSNMVGYTNYAVDYAPISKAYVYNQPDNSWVAPPNPISAYNVLGDTYGANKIGVHYGFLLDMVNYYPARKTAIVLAGVGGREIATFLPGNGSGYYSGALAAVKAAAEMSGGTIRGVLWHQGEYDSDDANKISQYEGKLKTLVNSLRTDLGIPDLPFIAGEITEDPKQNTYNRGVAFNVELNRIASSSSIPYLYVVQSDGLTLQDGWHFDSSSMLLLGQRYAAMIHNILSGNGN